ncbi:MAG: hypothetical protein ACO1TE_22225 [Prosthecobacter sp.]
MKAPSSAGFKGAIAFLAVWAVAHSALAQASGNCSEIANDVSVAVTKDPSKVLMVVEDALVINEGCAGDIVKAAIMTSNADSATANQIVQTAVSVAPKMAAVINDAASSVVPGLVAAAPAPQEPVQPIVIDEKNPGKNPVVPVETVVEEDFFVPSTIRGVYLIQPPSSGPLPCDRNKRCDCNPVSPAVAIP